MLRASPVGAVAPAFAPSIADEGNAVRRHRVLALVHRLGVQELVSHKLGLQLFMPQTRHHQLVLQANHEVLLE